VLVDTSMVPALLREHGVVGVVGTSFDDEERPLPAGLKSVIGRRP